MASKENKHCFITVTPLLSWDISKFLVTFGVME